MEAAISKGLRDIVVGEALSSRQWTLVNEKTLKKLSSLGSWMMEISVELVAQTFFLFIKDILQRVLVITARLKNVALVSLQHKLFLCQ